MRTFRSTLILGILAILVLTPSCSRSSSGGGNPFVALAAILVWNSPAAQYMIPRKAPLPRPLDTINLKHTGTTGDVEFKLEDSTGSLQATPATGVLRPGQEVAIKIATIALVAFTTVTMNMTLKYVDNTTIGPLIVPLAFALMTPGMFVMSVLSESPNVTNLFLAAIIFGLIGVLVIHSTADPLRNRIPALAFTEIMLILVVTLAMTTQLIQSSFWRSKTAPEAAAVNFPPGIGPIGYTIHPDKEVDMAAGEYHMFHMMMRDPIPIVDPNPAQLHTYAFVIDSDGDAANNWKPLPAFPADFWQKTDRWYQIDYSNKDSWSLKVSQVDSSNRVTEVSSAARAIIVEDSIVLVVPKSEIPGPGAKWRATSFVHQGDYGMNPPYLWSGDVEPPVTKPLVDVK